MLRFIKQINQNKTVINAYKNNIPIGNTISHTIGNSAYINNIEIYKTCRNNKLGTKLLKETENLLLENNIKKIYINAWEKQGENTSEFFLKNGYIPRDNNYNIYDNGEVIFDIIPMIKILYRSTNS